MMMMMLLLLLLLMMMMGFEPLSPGGSLDSGDSICIGGPNIASVLTSCTNSNETTLNPNEAPDAIEHEDIEPGDEDDMEPDDEHKRLWDIYTQGKG